ARLARFQREAEVLASLNHQHVGAIYGLEESAGVKALVMELVEGPTLADRIAQGPIPFDEALPIARQIAEALEAAHEQGIVHRDLKPANIKIRDDGHVKVLDFGLAKARESGGDSSSGIDLTVNVTGSPTFAPAANPSPAVSQAGAILGTAAYMSPEQARGRAVDKRSDVWAFGAVLYEMLTGRRAFDGEDVSELIAAVLKTTPDWSAIPADVPPHVVTLIQRCLEKDRKTRIGDIAVARFLLSGDAVAGPRAAGPTVAPAPPRSRLLPLWIAAALLIGAAIGWLLARRPVAPPAVTRLELDVRPAAQLAVSVFASERPARISIALSPDGRRLAFVGARDAGAPFLSQLYERTLDRGDAVPLAGTDGATAVFFSPDGESIGFVADNKIKKVPAGGGPVATVCDLPAGPFWGASWGEDANVVFGARGGLFTVPSGGGAPVAIKTAEPLKGGDRQLLPQLLPGGKAVVFTAPPDVVLLTLADGAQRALIQGGSDGRYVDTGHLVYMKRGTLMAVPFDAKSAQVTGAPVALIEGVMHGVNSGNGNDETEAGQFAIAKSGTIVYASGGIVPNRKATLTWVDRKGAAQPLKDASGRAFYNPRLSPDGRRVLMAIRREGSRDTDVWVYDTERGTTTRLTLDGGGWPVWSPDGTRVVYGFGINSASNLYMINADGSGRPERLTTSTVPQTPMSWSSGINAIVYLQRPTPDTFGIYALS
ncbi:MAG TPA: protein kinase, partial [Vicinamibacterales bacterium]|nr:protein kinase [Vicinamibacterales bacterium]